MSTVRLDTNGMRCPQPVLKIAAKMPEMKKGDILEVIGDCPTFEEDVRKWCARMKKTLLTVRPEGSAFAIQIQF